MHEPVQVETSVETVVSARIFRANGDIEEIVNGQWAVVGHVDDAKKGTQV